jgi:glycosyltransferase involved in cell wall biosynthesis
MRALVIAPQPFFSPRGTPYSVYYRTLVTSELGVEVDLLTYGEGEDVDIPGVRIYRIPRFGAFGNVKTGPSLLKLFLDGFILARAVALLCRTRYAFVHAHEESVFFCRFLKPLFGFKLVYDMHSSLPEQLRNFKFTESRVLIRAFEWLENTSLRASDAIITICPALADYVHRTLGDTPRHLLIENSIFDPVKVGDRNAGSPVSPSDPSAGTALEAKIPTGRDLVVYAGTLETYQGIDLLIAAFAKVLGRHPSAFLLVVGGTAEQVARYSTLAKEHGVADHCRFTGRVPQALARWYTSRASVLVSPRSAGTNTPLKVYEQLASGVPLVATRIYSHTQVLDDDLAFLVEPDANDMAEGMLHALTSASERERRSTNAKGRYERDYSRPAYVAKMRRLIDLLR